MSDLAGFLAARIAEDVAWAEGVLKRMDELGWTSEDDAWDARGAMGIAEWSAMQNAARVLREAEAKRARLERHRPEFRPADGDYTGIACGYCEHLWPCGDIRIDGAIWRDHADYDPGWTL
jgi:hypothetical protein